MNIREIEEIKNDLNGWNEDCLDNLRHYISDIITGVASDEVIAVIGCLEIIEGFRGWNIQLPSTKDVLNFRGEPVLHIYEWKEEFDYDKEKPIVWHIPSYWNESTALPPVIKRLIDDITYVNEQIRIELLSV